MHRIPTLTPSLELTQGMYLEYTATIEGQPQPAFSMPYKQLGCGDIGFRVTKQGVAQMSLQDWIYELVDEQASQAVGDNYPDALFNELLREVETAYANLIFIALQHHKGAQQANKQAKGTTCLSPRGLTRTQSRRLQRKRAKARAEGKGAKSVVRLSRSRAN